MPNNEDQKGGEASSDASPESHAAWAHRMDAVHRAMVSKVAQERRAAK